MNNLVKEVLLELRDLELEYEVEEEGNVTTVACEEFISDPDYFESVLSRAVEDINIDHEDEGELSMELDGSILTLTLL